MSDAKLQAARELILSEQYNVARAVLMTIKNSPTAQKWLTKLDEIAPVQEDTVGQWEYLEVYIKASERLPANLQSVLTDDNHLTTVDHFYSRMLNEYGAQGWELFSEEMQGGDLIRLLFKRMKPEE